MVETAEKKYSPSLLIRPYLICLQDITAFISQTLEDTESDSSLPDGITITNCVPWADAAQQAHGLPHRFTSSASLTLSSIPEKLFVISRGPLSTGLIRIVPSDSDQIGLSTTVQFNRKRELKHVKLCVLQGADGEIGVGLLVRPIIPFFSPPITSSLVNPIEEDGTVNTACISTSPSIFLRTSHSKALQRTHHS